MSTATRPSWLEARRLSFEAPSVGPVEFVALGEASGRRLARDVVALCDVPRYVSSAMDGWAISGAAPWRVVAPATLGLATLAAAALASGECRAIVTGAALPPGATAVLRSEHASTSREGDTVWVTTTPAARPNEPGEGQHVRLAGTEALEGELLIAAGSTLTLPHIALAASAGLDRLAVTIRPRVRLVLTGDEVVDSGVPPRGRVRDSFGPVLPALVGLLGGVVSEALHVPDSLPALIEALSTHTDDHEVLVTTGGTGSSSADHLRRALSDLGATVLVDGVRMRPGGPSLLARLADGRFLVGLPGNPLAAFLGLLTIGDPLLARMTGAPAPTPFRVTVAAPVEGRAATSLLIPYRLVDGLALPAERTGSAMMRGLADSVGVLVCPPDGIASGGYADAFALPWSSSVPWSAAR